MPEMAMVRAAVRSIAEFDSHAVDFGQGIRCAVGVTVALAIGIGTGHSIDGGAAAIGALSCGFASFQGVYRSRLATVVLAGLGMASASFAAAWLHRWAPAEIVLVSLFALAAGQLVALLGQAASFVGLQSVVAVIVLGQSTLSASVAGERAIWVLGGALVQGLLIVAEWPIRRFGAERHTLATAYRSLAAYARQLSAGPLTLQDPTTLRAAATILADPQPFAKSATVFAFRALLEEAERIRSQLIALGNDRQRLVADNDPRAATVDAIMAQVSADLDAVGERLEASRTPGPKPTAAAVGALDSLVKQLAPAPVEPNPSPADLAASDASRLVSGLAGQLRAVIRLESVPVTTETFDVTYVPLVGKRDTLGSTIHNGVAVLRANASLSSTSFRHALRMAITLAVADVVSRSTGLAHGYWIPLTVAIVLRPDFTSTVARGFARTLGTVGGAVVATALTVALRPSGWTDVAVVTVAAVGAYSLFQASYAAYTVCLTAIVAFLLSTAGVPTAVTVEQRTVSTVIGGALAMAAYWLWPTRIEAQVPSLLARQVRELRDYAQLVLDAWTGASVEQSRLGTAALAARRARSNSEAAIEQLRSERHHPGDVPAAAATTILDSLHRSGIALVSLAAGLDPKGRVSFPELSPLAHAIIGEFDGLLTALDALSAGGRAHPVTHPSRDLHSALAQTLSEQPADDPVATATLLELTDSLVDSLGTAIHAISA